MSLDESVAEQKPRVLIVDDEESIRIVFSRGLQSHGYVVDTAVNGEEALERYRTAQKEETPYDVIVSDVQMPVMSGPDFYKELKQDGQPCPILFVSGYISDEEQEKLTALGAAVLAKPFGIEVLAAKIQELYEQTTAQQSPL